MSGFAVEGAATGKGKRLGETHLPGAVAFPVAPQCDQSCGATWSHPTRKAL